MKWLIGHDLDSHNTPKLASIALLIIRIQMGVAFILHGWPKIQNAFSWMPPEAPIPGVLQGLAAFSEFAGGLALLFGILTRINAFGLLITMAVAAVFHISKGDPFVGHNGSWEPATVYLVLSILFLLVGPGDYSVDKIITKKI
jgi:putative oxidoreductase